MERVRGLEEEPAPDGREPCDLGGSRLGVDVADEDGARRRPVAAPEARGPRSGSSAERKTAPPNVVRPPGFAKPVPGLKSFTRMVPAAVPSLRQSSVLVAGWKARKSTCVPSGVSSKMSDEPGPTFTCATRAVPASVPSLRHSSAPVIPSLAWKKSVPLASTIGSDGGEVFGGDEPPGPD